MMIKSHGIEIIGQIEKCSKIKNKMKKLFFGHK